MRTHRPFRIVLLCGSLTALLLIGSCSRGLSQKQEPKSPQEALKFLQDKSSSDPWAKFYLALAYYLASQTGRGNSAPFEGLGLPEQTKPYWDAFHMLMNDQSFHGNPKVAVALWKENAEAGNAASMTYYGEMMNEGEGGLQNNPTAGDTWIQKGADLQDPFGMTLTAIKYMSLRSDNDDYSKAFPLLLKAAQSRNFLAMMLLSDLYKEGHGTPKNPSQAAFWKAQVDRIDEKMQSASSPARHPEQPAAVVSSGTGAVPQFSNTYADAPAISESEILASLKNVEVEIMADPKVQGIVSFAELNQCVDSSISPYGIQNKAGSPFKLRFSFGYENTEMKQQVLYTDGTKGDVEVVNNIHQDYVRVDVMVAIPVHRRDGFHLLNVSVMRNYNVGNGWNGMRPPHDYLIKDYCKQSTELMREIHDKTAIGTQRANSDVTRDVALNSQYLSALSSNMKIEPDGEFRALDDNPEIKIDAKDLADRFVNRVEWDKAWKEVFLYSPANTNGRLVMRHSVYVETDDANNASVMLGLSKLFGANAPYYVFAEIAECIEKGVVFPLGGRLVRSDGVLWSRIRYDFAVDSNVQEVVNFDIQKTVLMFQKEHRF